MRKATVIILVLVASILLARQLWPRHTPQRASPQTPSVQAISHQPVKPSRPAPVKILPYREDPFAVEQSSTAGKPAASSSPLITPLPQLPLPPLPAGIPFPTAEMPAPGLRPGPPAAEGSGAGETAPSVNQPVLIGIASGPNGRIAIIEVDGEIYRVKTGEMLFSWKVTIEESRKVVLVNSGGSIELTGRGDHD